jgi:hypothetical protein
MGRLLHQAGKIGTFRRIGRDSGNAAGGEQENPQEVGKHR